jgi:hypothetical protein
MILRMLCDEPDVGFQLHSMMRSRAPFLASSNGSRTAIRLSDGTLKMHCVGWLQKVSARFFWVTLVPLTLSVDIYSILETDMVNVHNKIIHENSAVANAAAIVLQATATRSDVFLFNFIVLAHIPLSGSCDLAGTWPVRISRPFLLCACSSDRPITITRSCSWQVPIILYID